MKCSACLLALLCAGSASAGGIRGVALEDGSGRPLARASIRIDSLRDGLVTQGKSWLTDRQGLFSLMLPDGDYLVSARRTGFAPAEYGQRRKLAPGRPVRVEGAQVQFLELRLPRLGAISGRVLDENGVGMPDHPVVVYRPQPPLQIVSSAKTDDRGAYRAGGLLPGRYLVRSGAKTDDDGIQWIPTFAPQSIAMRDAKIVDVELDRESIETNIEPALGRLFLLEGRVGLFNPPGAVRLTLATDTGRQQTTAWPGGGYFFQGLAPGSYELLAESEGGLAAHRELYIGSDIKGFNIQLSPMPQVEFRVTSKDAASPTTKEVGIGVRRRDYAGEGPLVPLSGSPAMLAPGFWDLTLSAPADFYWATLDTFPPRRRFRGADDDRATEIQVEDRYAPRVMIAMSNRPAKLRGVVRARGEKIAAAPVFLWPVNAEIRKRLGGWRQTRTGSGGDYRFESLAPGEYLVVSSFDLTTVNAEALRTASAAEVRLEEGRESTQDLDLLDPP